MDDAEYVCPYKKCRKINTTKDLLSLHLKPTQHHGCIDEDVEEFVSEGVEITNIVSNVMTVPDGPCVITDLRAFMSNTWDITYE